MNLERVWLENPAEKSGILNWMLQGLQRLLSNNCFTESKSQDETEILFERASDTIGAFLKEMAIYGKNYVTFRSYAFDLYKEYWEVFGLDQESDKKFTVRLKETRGITQCKHKEERAWKGFTLKEITEEGEIKDPKTGTDGTDRTHLLYFQEITDSKILKESRECVPSVLPETSDFDDKCQNPAEEGS